jgi:hypothetical protein
MRSEFDQTRQPSETLVTAKSAGKVTWPADHVERWPTERLIPFARNARTHSDAQVSQIASSIREWGWTNPVLVAERKWYDYRGSRASIGSTQTAHHRRPCNGSFRLDGRAKAGLCHCRQQAHPKRWLGRGTARA